MRMRWMLGLVAMTSVMAADEHEFVLCDSDRNLQVDAFELDSQQLPGAKAAWKISLKTLRGGKQEGVRLLTVDNGLVQIVMIPTRGMSIYEVRRGDVRLGWNSPVKEIVHPQHINLESRGGLGWIDGFNEWMVRCGLEFAGHPGKDVFTTNTGDRAEMSLSLHGKVGNIPASKVVVAVDKAAPHRLKIRSIVHERLFFGPKLELASELAVTPGDATFDLTDRVTNRGGADQEFQMIYHTNYGAPILGKGAKVSAAAAKLAPMNAHAAKAIDQYQTYAGPTPGFIEEVYLMHPFADAAGKTLAVLASADGAAAGSIAWSTKELPYFTLWKNTTSEPDGYVTGLEPATGFPYNRRVERAAGRLPKLKAGEERSFTLTFGMHVGKSEVDAVMAQVEKIAAGRTPEIQRTPPAEGGDGH